MTVHDLVNAVTSGNFDISLSRIGDSGELDNLRRRAQIISAAENFSRLYPLRDSVQVYFAPENAGISLNFADRTLSMASQQTAAVIVDFHGGDEINLSAGSKFGTLNLDTAESSGELADLLTGLTAEFPEISGFDMVMVTGENESAPDRLTIALHSVLETRYSSPTTPTFDTSLFFAGYSLCVTDVLNACPMPRPTHPHIDTSDDFYAQLPELMNAHPAEQIAEMCRYFAENRRSELLAEAMSAGNLHEFLNLVNDTAAATPETEIALNISAKLLAGEGATISAKGCIQAFVPTYTAAGYKAEMERIYGIGRCRIFPIGGSGAIEICR